MKTGTCRCGNRIFFASTQCVACGAVLGHCGSCGELTSLAAYPEEKYQCEREECRSIGKLCDNRRVAVCNSVVSVDADRCEWCALTEIVPNLDLAENRTRWRLLEQAKRRLLHQLRQLDLPPYVPGIQGKFPLKFRFQAGSDAEPVYTGHSAGVISINVLEADSVYREKTRVQCGEPQRTLIGHMRHEYGHYLQWCYVDQTHTNCSRRIFGDPMAVDYEQAKQQYYRDGPPADWSHNFASAYAAMHPWEDLAETVNAYLDVVAIADTANNQGLQTSNINPMADVREMVQQTLELAVLISEFNLDLGLGCLLPEQLSEPVLVKMSFVHQLRQPASLAKLREVIDTQHAN